MSWVEGLGSNWHFLRIIRLLLALMIGGQALMTTDWLAGMIAVFFLYQVVTNTGCCGMNTCAPQDYKGETSMDDEVTFTEIKEHKTN